MKIPLWPESGLEHIGKCPVCCESSRTLLHEGLFDRLVGAPGLWTMYRCNGCDSGYLDPRPTRGTIGLAYANYFTHSPDRPLPTRTIKLIRLKIRNGYLNRKYGYRESPAWRAGFWVLEQLPFPFRGEWDYYARHMTSPNSGMNRLLDVGCGNGEFLRHARDAGWIVQGTDIDPEAAESARKHGVPVWTGQYHAAPFESASFDVITANQVIEHVHDPMEFLRTLYRWLKPGGRLWIGTPNLDCPVHEQFGEFYRDLHPPHHLILFNRRSLTKLVTSAGFEQPVFLKRGFINYTQTVISAALAHGSIGHENVFRNARNASLKDRLLGWLNELHAWINPAASGDFVLMCEKPLK